MAATLSSRRGATTPPHHRPSAHPNAYRYAVERRAVPLDQAMLVAVHPWDVDGARRAGPAGTWLRRGAPVCPESLTEPALAAEDLTELARLLS
ncbi:hypothetical protein ABT063_35535 [Streptomyces sp. NPDC002838]|uniref:hypothetical protein n=1 Tax=Streptomyces sp. NPDC002838 TaxID=3154436 RepID=UPI00332970CD